MALGSTTRIEVDIIIRKYKVDYIDDKGNDVQKPEEKLDTEIRQNGFDGIVEALRYLITKL